jgi:hypothetical protein
MNYNKVLIIETNCNLKICQIEIYQNRILVKANYLHQYVASNDGIIVDENKIDLYII